MESTSGTDKLTELSIMVFNPTYVLAAYPRGRIELLDRLNSTGITSCKGDPLLAVKKMVQSSSSSKAVFRFLGGALGYISYEAVNCSAGSLQKGNGNDSSLFPDVQFGLYEEGVVFDHKTKKAFYFFSDRVKDRSREIEEVCNKTDRGDSTSDRFAYSKPETNISKEEFEDSVTRAKDYIKNGDVFQVVLSKKRRFKVSGDLLKFYSELRTLNPSPYMYFLDMGEAKIVGSSPEMLARVDSGIVETFPIAGTRPASKDESENMRLAKELLQDQKERAEHIMLVDLARNDVGRISEFGSVTLDEFMQVHRYSHVQHIVSHVRGRLRRGLDSFDAVSSLFPAGTVSGAPKIRAMEIIKELETESRGPYAGAVGYFSFNGNMDSAITIRTLVARDNEASIQAGAGIVADSEPEAEWFETERKAAALFKALDLAADHAGDE